MSTKAQITASINTIDDGGNNTASEVRSVFETLNNEFFPSVDTYTGVNADNVFYKFDFAKIGNIVFLNIAIRNQASLSVGGQTFLFSSLNIPNKYQSLFAPHGLISQTGFSPISYQVGTLGVTIGTTIPATGGQFRGTITYISNND
jgi:hypothetical protein